MTTNPSRKFLISIIILCGSSYMFVSQIKVEASILGFRVYAIFIQLQLRNFLSGR